MTERNPNVVKLAGWQIVLFFSILGTVVLAHVRNEQRFSRLETHMEAKESWRGEMKKAIDDLRMNVTSALKVAEQHGGEMQLLREDILGINKRIAVMRDDMRQGTDDRFRYTQWESEKGTLMRLYDGFERRIQEQEARQIPPPLFLEKVRELEARIETLEGHGQG